LIIVVLSDLVNELKIFVRKALGNSFEHGYPHIERVLNNAYEIVDHEELDIDRNILTITVLLHDIGRLIGEPHAYYSSLFAKAYLSDRGVSSDVIDCVVNAILYHSYSYVLEHNIKPICEISKILSDADKLDALGVVGFIRVFLYGERVGRSLKETMDHFNNKILNLHKLMHYRYSREKALKLRERILEMLRYLNDELILENKV